MLQRELYSGLQYVCIYDLKECKFSNHKCELKFNPVTVTVTSYNTCIFTQLLSINVNSVNV